MSEKSGICLIIALILYQSFSYGFLPYYGLFNFKGIGRPPVKPPTCGFPIKKCDAYSVFRRFDGSCTNPSSPTLGMAGDTYINILTPRYEDGRRLPTATGRGRPLPLVRDIKNQLFPDGSGESPDGNLLFVAFGQMMAHDISRILETTHEERCCSNSWKTQSNMHWSCFPFSVPKQDPMYTRQNIECQNFTRAQTDADFGCKTGHWAKQINSVTAALDMSVIYGSSKEVNYSLRTLCNGKLKTVIRNGTTLPPITQSEVANCQTSFELGDNRSNQNAALTAIHILLLKQHNRVASALETLNPHWDDFRLFHEARRILIAQYQYIAYYEWLPLVISKDTLEEDRIIYPKSPAHVHDYNSRANLSPSNEYAHSAFVYFHSIIPEHFEFRHNNGTVNRYDWSSKISCQDILTRPGSLEQLHRGMATQPMAIPDKRFSEATTEKFDKRNNNMFGTDIRSIDLQRGRDIGLGSYSDYKLVCGDTATNSFEDFEDSISKEDVAKLKVMYASPESVELTVGGTLELHAPGSKIGPTFECLITDQFLRTRVGDYLWFEHSSAGFTTEQLDTIKDSSISNIMCKNADGVTRMQPSGFAPPNQRNAAKDCSQIADTDFSKWRETR